MLFAASHPATGENLIPLGHFDEPSAIDVWTVTNDGGEGDLSFAPSPDEAGCASSGSALLVTSSSAERDVTYSVCATGLAGGTDYAVGFEVNFPDGESAGQLFWAATWLDGPDCTGSVLSSVWLGPVSYGPEWQTVELWGTTQPETASILLELWVASPDSAEPLRLNVDRAFVRPVAELFADGFELGEICRWATN